MNFLQYDSAFMTALRKTIDYFLLGFLWVLASIGLITFGAATTAMFYTAEKAIRKEEGKLFGTFWRCFAREFKQATVLGLIYLPLSIILAFNVFILWGMDLSAVTFTLILVASLVMFSWMTLWFGYLSFFKDSVLVVLSNTFRMVFIYIPWVVLLLVVNIAALAGTALAFVYMPPVLVLVPGLYVVTASGLCRRIFNDYLPKDVFPQENDVEVEA